MGPPKHPDWLPEGWKVGHKVRSFGKKVKYYINLSNGLTLHSKPEVLCYLESSEECWKPKRPNEISIEKFVAEDLPPGWIKEIRTKKIGKIRSDAYYIDPESRHHFRSMQEVLRYLKSKESREASSKHEEECHINHSQSSSAEAKGQMSIDKKGDKNLTRHESVTSGSKLATDVNVNMLEDNSLEQRKDDSDEPNVVKVVKQHGEGTKKTNKSGDKKVDEIAKVDQTPKSGPNVSALKNAEKPVVEQREGEEESVVENLPKKPTPVNKKKRRNGGMRQSTRLANSKVKDNVTKDLSLQSGSEAVAEKDINLPENNGLNQNEKENTCTIHKNKRKHSNGKRASDLPLRTSKRLARSDVDPLIEANTSNESEASVRLPDEPEIDTSTKLGRFNESNEQNPANNEQKKAIINKTPSSLEEHKGVDVECNEEEIDTSTKLGRFNESNEQNPANNEQKKAIIIKTPSSLEEQKKAIINKTPSSLEEHKGADVECNEDQKDQHHLESSLKDLLMDPCIEFAIKTLTGAIPIEAGSQTSTSSSMNMPSSDPGFEFAVKTLKGDEDTNNGSQFQISFKKPSFISFSQFNGIKNPWLRQQNPVDASGFEGQKGKFM